MYTFIIVCYFMTLSPSYLQHCVCSA